MAGGKTQGLVRDAPFLASLFLIGALGGWTKPQVGGRLRLQEAEMLPWARTPLLPRFVPSPYGIPAAHLHFILYTDPTGLCYLCYCFGFFYTIKTLSKVFFFLLF